MSEFTEVSYVIDAHDRLISVSKEWLEFALDNHGEGLTPPEVEGRSLWEFITDEPTRELYQGMLARVRSGTETDLVLRCDSPESRRLIEMIVTGEPDGSVRFRTVLLAVKPRKAERLLDKDTPRTQRRVMLCSWCDKVNVGIEKWFEVEAAMESLHLTGETELPMIEPVTCPECYAKVSEIIGCSEPLEDTTPASA